MDSNFVKCWIFYIDQPGKVYPVWYSTAYDIDDAKKHFEDHKPAFCLEGLAMRQGGTPRPINQIQIKTAAALCD